MATLVHQERERRDPMDMDLATTMVHLERERERRDTTNMNVIVAVDTDHLERVRANITEH